jgi:hypothetical protein
MGAGPERQLLIRDLAEVQGIIYMFDPTREIDHGDAFQTADNLLWQLSRQVANSTGGRGRKLEHYVAVCVTKFDERGVLNKALQRGLVTTDRGDPYGFPRVPEDRAREFLDSLSTAPDSSSVGQLLSTFDRFFLPDHIRYFITSAVGFYVDPQTQKFNPHDPSNVSRPTAWPGRPTIRGPIHPINVVEPLVWLARQIAGPSRARSRQQRR